MSGNSSANDTAIAALNVTDTLPVTPPYVEDSVFMPQSAPSVVGKGRYDKPMTRCSRRFRSGASSPSRKSLDGAAMGVLAENAAGTQKSDATGAVSAEGNRELFTFGATMANGAFPATASSPPIQPRGQRPWMPR
jgi:hypothetical protein